MKRDLAIDFLKFLAVILVVNSHLDVCYPNAYQFLATGGSLGDALFFFCSGFTLFLGRDGGFVPWYKRRLVRILPSVIVCAFALACYYGPAWWSMTNGYWFIRCILIYYVLLYVVRRRFAERLWLPLFGTFCLCIVWWVIFENPTNSIYAGSYFMWAHYFVPMLVGAIAGLHHDNWLLRPIFDIVMTVASCALYLLTWRYALTHASWEWMQLMSIPFLSLTVLYVYKLARSSIIARVMNHGTGWIVNCVGGLCLEVYLSHRVLIGLGEQLQFPINILVIFVGIVVLAYCLRCISRFVTQTLNGAEGYDWCGIIKI